MAKYEVKVKKLKMKKSKLKKKIKSKVKTASVSKGWTNFSLALPLSFSAIKTLFDDNCFAFQNKIGKKGTEKEKEGDKKN